MRANGPGRISFWGWVICSALLITVLLVNLVQLNLLPTLVLAPFALVSALRVFSIAQLIARRESKGPS